MARICEVLEAARPHVRRLRRLVRLLELHDYGPLFEILNTLTLWELRFLPFASSLVERHRELLLRSAGALGDAEAFLCLSQPLAEQEGFELPEILGGNKPSVEAAEVGHPLLDHTLAVRNPVCLGRGCNVLIVTGSNMAGKSTYLKSVAVNLVLAGMGGPVCARGFRWTPMALYSDINVRDSLDDGKSYFQVEVERVLEILAASRECPMVLAVFDELFRGTNSAERIALARAILRHLRSAGVLCLVATHDLSLTEMVTEDGEPGMENRHFRETVEDGEMRFDYRLRDGPATTRNAIRLLESYGYPPEIIREARGAT
jgi:DNA mismatch repair ATPase MutS